MSLSRYLLVVAVAGGVAAGCGESEPGTRVATGGTEATAVPSPTGEIHDVQMKSIGGEIYDPDRITARRGDVVRFVLQSGVHNVSFPADMNPAGVQLPEASPYLQVPGQTWDLVVDLPPGEYYYQCDPHVALGMVGWIQVVD